MMAQWVKWLPAHNTSTQKVETGDPSTMFRLVDQWTSLNWELLQQETLLQYTWQRVIKKDNHVSLVLTLMLCTPHLTYILPYMQTCTPHPQYVKNIIRCGSLQADTHKSILDNVMNSLSTHQGGIYHLFSLLILSLFSDVQK